jgi:hypothetical protein
MTTCGKVFMVDGDVYGLLKIKLFNLGRNGFERLLKKRISTGGRQYSFDLLDEYTSDYKKF